MTRLKIMSPLLVDLVLFVLFTWLFRHYNLWLVGVANVIILIYSVHLSDKFMTQYEKEQRNG